MWMWKVLSKWKKPTSVTTITGIVYGLDENWHKTQQQTSETTDPRNGIELDGGKLGSVDDRYVIQLSDNINHKFIYYK
jgi:hypothetical protein